MEGFYLLMSDPHPGVVAFPVKSLTEPLHDCSLVKDGSWVQISFLSSTYGVGDVSRA